MTHIKYKKLHDDPDGYKYQALNTYHYYSKRYNRWATVTEGDKSDGATGAWDIASDSWWVHDQLCRTCEWDDGATATNWDASTVLADILWSEGRHWRAFWWWWATYIFGGDKAKDDDITRFEDKDETK